MSKVLEAAAISFSHPAIVHPIGKKATLIGMEVFQIFGYVPGIGVIVGLARMILAPILLDNKNEKELRAFQMLRGAAEIVGLGPIMLITDFIATGIIFHLKKKHDDEVMELKKARTLEEEEFKRMLEAEDEPWRNVYL